MPNLGKHGVKRIGDISVPQFVHVYFTRPLDVLWVGALVRGTIRDTESEFRNSSFNEAVNVE